MKDEDLIRILKVLANKNRFAILKCLHKHKELSVGDLAEITDRPFRSVSRNLFVLRKAKLVHSRDFYAQHIYSINFPDFPKGILKIFRMTQWRRRGKKGNKL